MSISTNINIVNASGETEWTLKAKWHHVLFWCSYFMFWLIVSWSGSLINNVIFNITFLVFNIFPVYTILYYLMPKYLYAQRYITFTLLTIGLVLLSSTLLGVSLYIIHVLRDLPLENYFTFPAILGPTLGSVGTSVLFFMVAKLVKNYTLSEQKNKMLQHEKTENELKFLKSQLNPHLLFNALNNIYFLIKKDPDTAAETLAKFSDMVRYQLYECNEDNILLSQEIYYINNYVKINSLGKSETTDIKVNIGDYPNNLSISPLILVPLIENAFKHVSENDAGKNYIDIAIHFSDDRLICKTKNSFDKHKTDNGVIVNSKHLQHGGLGLTNLKRRLSLLYPNNHKLEITGSKGVYSSNLELKL